MAYATKEASAHDGSPIEGFEFIGTNATYRYTSSEKDRTINGVLFTAAEIQRSAIRSGTQDDDSLELELTVPHDLQLVLDYAYDSSPPDLDVTVYRYHDGDDPSTDFVRAWVGKVTAFSVTGKEAKIRVPSVFELSMEGAIPSTYYHHPCNHVLYDARCKVVQATFQQNTTIASGGVSPSAITVVDDGFADEVLRAGEILLTAKDERRLIIDNVANVITINFPFHNAEVGDLVQLIAGCNHSLTACRDKFSNTLNYGGFPLTPTDNPFTGEL